MIIQWQEGQEPKKQTSPIGKMYILLPRQQGQVLLLHRWLWRPEYPPFPTAAS